MAHKMSFIFYPLVSLVVVSLYLYTSVFDAPLKTKTFFDREARVVGTLNPQNYGTQIWTPLEQIPPKIQIKTIEEEDRWFWFHPGFNPVSSLSAAYENFSHRRVVRGGSTITEQVAKNMIQEREGRPPKRTLWNKLRRVALAVGLELRHSKSWIIERYLNTAYYGHGCYGIAAAARCYFSKELPELTDREIATLTKLLRAPNKMSAGLDVHRPSFIAGRHFIAFVAAQENDTNVFYTTLDLGLQSRIEASINNIFADWVKSDPFVNAAAVVIDVPTGDILAMIGSRDYFDPQISGQYNSATASRQPGSALKPFTYFALLAKGLSPDTIIPDEPLSFYTETSNAQEAYAAKAYIPQNFDRRFHGDVSLKDALANSYNVPAVVALNKIGLSYYHDTLRRFGFTTFTKPPSYYGLAATLGSGEVTLLELTNAYAALSRGGTYLPYHYLRGERGEPREVVPDAPRYATKVSAILSDAGARLKSFGFNENLVVEGHEVAVKTGTSHDHKDNWTIGYTPKYAVGVWVGHSDSSPLDGTTGATGAAPVWHAIMETLVRGNEPYDLAGEGVLKEGKGGRISYDDGRGWRVVSPLPYATYRVSRYLPREHQEILADVLVSGAKATSLDWYYDGVLVANANNQVWLPTEPGDHLIQVKSSDGLRQEIPIRIVEEEMP